MKLLSRAQLLELSEEALLGTAACHGIETAGRRANEVIDELADLIEDFSYLAGGDR